MGTAESRLAWRGGRIEAALGEGQWAGMWHSLEGLARERDRTLDFARCYPRFIRPEAQPRCVGVVVRAYRDPVSVLHPVLELSLIHI